VDSYWLFASIWFLAAAAPGADTVLLVSTTLASGWKSAIPISLGITFAKVILLLAAFFGLSSLLTAAPQAFVVLKALGCAFLLWRAFKLWTSSAISTTAISDYFGKNFALSFTTGISNPQALLFYIAVVPQVTASTNPLALCMIIILGFSIISAFYILLATPIRAWIGRGNNQQTLNRAIAIAFVLLAGMIALR
jgi:threonine/homoserine/homoserine lactone efflux protein